MNQRHFLAAVLLILAVTMLAGCRMVSEPTPVPVTAADVEQHAANVSVLRDTAWTVLTMGVEEQFTPIEGSFPSITFMGDRYSGYTGCNFMLGVYNVTGSTMQIRWPSMTQGACASDELFQQENGFLSALTAVEEFEIDGELLNLYVAGQKVMTLETLNPVPFEGTTWTYQFLQNNQYKWQPVIPGTTITAVFEGEQIFGNAGCNDYNGIVISDGKQMSISDLATTMMMCDEPEGVMEQEQQYLEELATTGLISGYPRSFELRDTEMLPLMLFYAE